MGKYTIDEICKSMDKIKKVTCWYNDKNIVAALDYGVKQGFLIRMSHTQIEWTEKGVYESYKHRVAKILTDYAMYNKKSIKEIEELSKDGLKIAINEIEKINLITIS